MALEFPNTLLAMAFVNPDPNAIAELGTPFMTNEGFQPYNPATNGSAIVDPNPNEPSGILGGWTQVEDTPTYIMKLIEGVGFFESFPMMSDQQTTFAPAFVAMFPSQPVPGFPFPPDLIDGKTLAVAMDGFSVYQIGVWRMNTSTNNPLELALL